MSQEILQNILAFEVKLFVAPAGSYDVDSTVCLVVEVKESTSDICVFLSSASFREQIPPTMQSFF